MYVQGQAGIPFVYFKIVGHNLQLYPQDITFLQGFEVPFLLFVLSLIFFLELQLQ